MKDDEYKGYYCLLIAILCDLNAAEAITMYEYGPDHPLCRKILKKKVRKPSIKKLKETEQAAAMKALLDQGYSQDAVAEPEMEFPCCKRKRKQLQWILYCAWKRTQGKREKG